MSVWQIRILEPLLPLDKRNLSSTDGGHSVFIFLAINGKIFGNLPGLIMTEDSMTNWYLLGIGSEVDIHTIHYHAESFLFKVSMERGSEGL